mgnify:CR=1 FL=1
MDAILPYIIDLKKRVYLLIGQHNDLKKRNLDLGNENNLLLQRITLLEDEIKELKERVEIVDMAKGVGLKEAGSVDFARGRLNTLIRQIDKCISMLNE